MEDFIFKCPKKGGKKCFCLENIISNKSDQLSNENSKKFILKIHNESKILRKLRSIDLTSTEENDAARRTLGCGRKKSLKYIKFVIENREKFKDLGLCESASKHILLYSNNLLHRKLKFDDEKRNITTEGIRTKGAAGLGKLKALDIIRNIRCCKNYCTKLIERLPKVVNSWRERSCKLNQRNTHKVLSEMLLPSANGNRNCNRFIHLVTGCCRGTINKVYSEMKCDYDGLNSKQHGLVTYLKNKSKDTNSQAVTTSKQKSKRHIAKSILDPSYITRKDDRKYCLSTNGSLLVFTSNGDLSIPVSIGIPLSVEKSVNNSVDEPSFLNMITSSIPSSSFTSVLNSIVPPVSDRSSSTSRPTNYIQPLVPNYSSAAVLSASDIHASIFNPSSISYKTSGLSNTSSSLITRPQSIQVQPVSVFSSINDISPNPINSSNNFFGIFPSAAVCPSINPLHMNTPYNSAQFPVASNTVVDANINLYIANQTFPQSNYNQINILPTPAICQQNIFIPACHSSAQAVYTVIPSSSNFPFSNNSNYFNM